MTGRIQQLLSHLTKAGSSIRSADIRDLYKKQEGKCFYTGVDMELMGGIKNNPRAMSVDRVDSSRGYDLDNVVLTCYGLNCLKGRHSAALMFENLKHFYAGAVLKGNIDA